MGFWNVYAKDLQEGDELAQIGSAEYRIVKRVEPEGDAVRVRLVDGVDRSCWEDWVVPPNDRWVVRR